MPLCSSIRAHSGILIMINVPLGRFGIVIYFMCDIVVSTRRSGRKIEIKEENVNETEVVISCRRADEKILRLRDYIANFGSKIRAKSESGIEHVSVSEIYYFETVDNRTFLYTEKDVFELSMRLYELEEIMDGRDFFRISRTQILNINHAARFKPEINRTLTATMENGEKINISRKYSAEIKRILKESSEVL